MNWNWFAHWPRTIVFFLIFFEHNISFLLKHFGSHYNIYQCVCTGDGECVCLTLWFVSACGPFWITYVILCCSLQTHHSITIFAMPIARCGLYTFRFVSFRFDIHKALNILVVSQWRRTKLHLYGTAMLAWNVVSC